MNIEDAIRQALEQRDVQQPQDDAQQPAGPPQTGQVQPQHRISVEALLTATIGQTPVTSGSTSLNNDPALARILGADTLNGSTNF